MINLGFDIWNPFLQEAAGYFFCLEDRALLCRRCDVAVHTANRLVSKHQRFLLTGVKVGLEAQITEPEPGGSSLSSEKTHSHSDEKSPGSNPPSAPKKTALVTIDQTSESPHVQGGNDSSSLKQPLGGSTSGGISQWQLDEFLELGDYGQNCDFMSQSSSKVQSVHMHFPFGRLSHDDSLA